MVSQHSYTRFALKGNRKDIIQRNLIISEKTLLFDFKDDILELCQKKIYSNFFCLEKNTNPPPGFKILTQAFDLRLSIFPRAISPSKFMGVICVSQNKLRALTIIRLIIWTMKYEHWVSIKNTFLLMKFSDRRLRKQRNKEILQYYKSN